MTYPVCERCGGEIDPVKYDDCDKAYRTDEGLLCKECFKNYLEERYSLDDLAELLGVVIVYQ